MTPRPRTRLALPLLAALIIAQGTPAQADIRSDEEARISAIYQAGMLLGTGGTYGFYVKPVGGVPELSRAQDHVFDPASAIKALHHLYAVKRVRAKRDGLTKSVTVYRYPTSWNAGGDPSNPYLCPNENDEKRDNAETMQLQDALRKTMVDSNNRTTRALELRYGRTDLNKLAQSSGMYATRLDQIVGCGYEGGHRNATTLVDLGTLYESVASLRSTDRTGRSLFYDHMIGYTYGPGYPFVETVVRDEARKLGIEHVVAEFARAMTVHNKGGSYIICTSAGCLTAEIVQSLAGVLTIPYKASGVIAHKDYVYGSFIEGLRVPCQNLVCTGSAQAAQIVDKSAQEMFRTVVRKALQTWR